MKWSILSLSLFLLIFGTRIVVAQERSTSATTFAVANSLYDNGNYKEASRLYEQLAAECVADGRVYFNLGNAYYQQENIGRALLNHRRALQLAPRDTNIRANLTQLRQERIDQLPQDSVLASVLSALSWLTINEIALIPLGLWTIWAALFVVMRRVRHPRWGTRLQSSLILLGLLTGIVVALFGANLYIWQMRSPAVIVAEEVSLARGAGKDAMKIHGGTELLVDQQNAVNWHVTLVGTEISGWIPASSAELVACTPQ